MKINLLMKGIIIGIAKIIPGFSGAILMISFNLYDKAIEAMTNFFANPRKNFSFLFQLSLGVGLGIVFFSKIITYFLLNYPLYTSILLLGLITGGIPEIKKEIHIKKDFFLVLLSMLVIFLLSKITGDNYYTIKNTYQDFLFFMTSGFLEAVGTIVPGVSSTLLLMLMGVYNYYLQILGNIFNFTLFKNNFVFLFPFSIGFLLGVILMTILVNYLFKNYKQKTYAIIFGLLLSTILILLFKYFPQIKNLNDLIICSLLFFLGIIATKNLNKKT